MVGPKDKVNYSKTKDGSVTYHDDGSSSRRYGDVTYHSDGSTSRTYGDVTYHDDGSTSKTYGDTTYNSDGSTSKTYGNTTYSDDGSTSKTYGGSDDNSSSGCYLTTACVIAKNLPDDCEELTILRKFRDGYLNKQENGLKDISHYYDVAPKIVSRIKKSDNATEQFKLLYETLVKPCVNYIKAGQNDEAYALYKATALKLEKENNF